MAFIKGTYPPLIGGVSQQGKHARMPNQVTQQVNMLSDVVTGPRRRAGMRLIRDLDVSPSVLVEVLNVGQVEALVLVDTSTGKVLGYRLDGARDKFFEHTTKYLKDVAPNLVRIVQHSNNIYFLNTTRIVEKSEPEPEPNVEPSHQGYFYIATGALFKTFWLTIEVDGTKHTVEHKTPESGADKAAPEVVADALMTKLAAHAEVGNAKGYDYHRVGGYVYIKAPNPIKVDSATGSTYVRTSGASIVKDTSQLPAQLPEQAEGYVIQVGYEKAAQYYYWDYHEAAWKERAAYNQRYRLKNLPVVLNAETLELTELEAGTRPAGNADNNPDPHFVTRPITGMGSFQGRLVLLTGEYVSMSASAEVGRWYRRSMTTLDDDDPIEIASTTTLGVDYQYAIPYNGDLLLASEHVQGMIGGRTVVTPKNAVISVASQYRMQPNVRPVSTGKTLLYPTYSSIGYSTLWEMLPSEFAEGQLYAQNIMEHLPQYIAGEVKQITTSQTAGIAVILDSSNRLIVHQYLWEGSEKVHSAFHEWTFQEEILAISMRTNLLHVVAKDSRGRIRQFDWDVISGLGDTWKYQPKLDGFIKVKVQDSALQVPAWMYSKEELSSGRILVQVHLGNNTPHTITVKDWEREGDYYIGHSDYLKEVSEAVIGYQFKSVLEPTAPVLKDWQGTPILTERAVLHRVTFQFERTGVVQVQVKDRARSFETQLVMPIRMYSNDLDAGEPIAGAGTEHIPCRTDMQSTRFILSTDGVYDMNITAIEFSYRHNQRGRRERTGGE